MPFPRIPTSDRKRSNAERKRSNIGTSEYWIESPKNDTGSLIVPGRTVTVA